MNFVESRDFPNAAQTLLLRGGIGNDLQALPLLLIGVPMTFTLKRLSGWVIGIAASVVFRLRV